MAYMSQEKKKAIAAELKKIMPREWKWTLGVDHHSTIVLNIWSAPVDLLAIVNGTRKAEYERRFNGEEYPYQSENYIQLNQYHLSKEFAGNDEMLKLFGQIHSALNRGNHDNSRIEVDYFDVGWYVSINLGRWNKPFKYIPKTEAQKALDEYWAGSITASVAKKYEAGDYVVVGDDNPKPGSPEYERLKQQIAALQGARIVATKPKPRPQPEIKTERELMRAAKMSGYEPNAIN